ncbi:MAG TPA: DUF4399 domain-containing protein [Mariprofundaceae bacterium]|nr:DUF4399 domain-containing protein [Mariprofundaceae bacterium]
MKKLYSMAVAIMMLAGATAAHAGGEGVYFASPANGSSVGHKVKVVMGVVGMKVHHAGKVIKNTGHFHLIVDGAYVPKGQVVPKDATHMHFGKGQTETTITLPSGPHTLTLQFADGHHVSYGKVMSRTIHVTVR